MKASERKITKLFSESDTVFSIPVYQRDYNWQEKQCQRLFKDILQTGKNEKVSSYFLGSIVYIHDGIYGVGEKEFHVIDGQQRMTTLTLLFLAIYFKLKGTILAKDADKIYNQYVVNPYSEKEIKLKLLPPEENLYILNKISHNKFNELDSEEIRSNFIGISEEEQAKVLLEILNLITNKKSTFDLKIIKMTAARGIASFNLRIQNQFSIIEQSVTGFYEKEITIIGDKGNDVEDSNS